MASGRLGTVEIDGTTKTVSTSYDVYSVPASTLTSCNISVCNRTSAAVKVRLSIGTVSATPSDDEYIEYDTSVAANSVLERTGVLMDATNKYLTFSSDTADVNCVVWGIEEAV